MMAEILRFNEGLQKAKESKVRKKFCFLFFRLWTRFLCSTDKSQQEIDQFLQLLWTIHQGNQF